MRRSPKPKENKSRRVVVPVLVYTPSFKFPFQKVVEGFLEEGYIILKRFLMETPIQLLGSLIDPSISIVQVVCFYVFLNDFSINLALFD